MTPRESFKVLIEAHDKCVLASNNPFFNFLEFKFGEYKCRIGTTEKMTIYIIGELKNIDYCLMRFPYDKSYLKCKEYFNQFMRELM